MSQFRDTFTKDEQRENLLDYDDNAFLFFVCSVLTCAILPWTYFFLRRCLNVSNSYIRKYPEKTQNGCIYRHCSCSICYNKREKIKAELSSFKNRFLNKSRLIEFIVLTMLWVLLIWMCMNLKDVDSIKTFDPFEILDVPPDATKHQIKKAYRLMSLKYHPDKNVNDPTTGAKFIMIAKAYQALTDEVAKKNYEKYGNPDGPGAMKIGVGLPRMLVEEKNQLFILCFFFLFLLIVLPMIFLCYYQKKKNYSPNGVMVDTVQFLTHCMTEGTRVRNCPELIAAGGESRAMKIEREDDKEMRAVCDAIVESKKKMFTIPIVVRNYYLIVGHMQRLHPLMSQRLRNQLNQLIKDGLPITQCMLEIAVLSDWLHTSESVIDFRRCLIQALDLRSSSLLQIPHFTDDVLRHCHRGKNAVRDLRDFVRQSPEDRKGIVDMTPEQQLDIQAFCNHVTMISLEADVVVEDEDEIVVGDVATCRITLTRTNLKENEAIGAIHAPYLDEPKYEEWWLFLVDRSECVSSGGKILNFTRCTNPERVVKETMQFRASRCGRNILNVFALCDSYSGVDCSVEVQFGVYSPNEKPREVFVHPEDAKLDEEPTLFQQMLGDVYMNSSDEEEAFEPDEEIRASMKKKPPPETGSSAPSKRTDVAGQSASTEDKAADGSQSST